MTLQEIFDRVVTHLLTQNRTAMRVRPDGYDACAYRSPDGLKCAVGCLIADDVYQPSLEGIAANHRRIVEALERSGITLPPDGTRLLDELQHVHDECAPDDWPGALRQCARMFRLKYNPPRTRA